MIIVIIVLILSGQVITEKWHLLGKELCFTVYIIHVCPPLKSSGTWSGMLRSLKRHALR